MGVFKDIAGLWKTKTGTGLSGTFGREAEDTLKTALKVGLENVRVLVQPSKSAGENNRPTHRLVLIFDEEPPPVEPDDDLPF